MSGVGVPQPADNNATKRREWIGRQSSERIAAFVKTAQQADALYGSFEGTTYWSNVLIDIALAYERADRSAVSS